MNTIAQTRDAITLGEYSFPSQFLLDREFPPLPDGISRRYYDAANGIFWQSDGKTQKSAGSIPWEDGDKFLKQAEALFNEYQSLLQSESPANEANEEIADLNPDRFLLHASQSQLYQLGKSSTGQARIEFEEVREIINGRMLFLSEAIADGGLLQKNLRELVTALGNVPENAIAEFNQLIKDNLGQEWTI